MARRKAFTGLRGKLAGGVATAAVALVLVGLAGCGGGGVNPVDRVKLADLPELNDAIQKFRAECGRFPTEREGLQALVTKPASPDIAGKWAGPYLIGGESRLKDPWGTVYQYRLMGQGPVMWSAGPDREPDTADDIARPPEGGAQR